MKIPAMTITLDLSEAPILRPKFDEAMLYTDTILDLFDLLTYNEKMALKRFLSSNRIYLPSISQLMEIDFYSAGESLGYWKQPFISTFLIHFSRIFNAGVNRKTPALDRLFQIDNFARFFFLKKHYRIGYTIEGKVDFIDFRNDDGKVIRVIIGRQGLFEDFLF